VLEGARDISCGSDEIAKAMVVAALGARCCSHVPDHRCCCAQGNGCHGNREIKRDTVMTTRAEKCRMS
jgi:hypothetical protein